MARIEVTADELKPLVQSVVRELVEAGALQDDDRLLLTQDEAARILSISQRTLADLPDVPSVKLGKCRR